ncbi:MAG: hypothetical protein IT445_01085 [Phycisphaeraceae bacterium]|nr:hypothetical protein [Phycisphaeraceae bacterium]
MYLGRIADGRNVRVGCHDAIVNQATFDATQRQLNSRRTNSRRRRVNHDNFTFRQKIVCPRCGRFLNTYQITKRHSLGAEIAYCYYRCRSTAGGLPPCQGVQYGAWDIEEGIRFLLNEHETWRTLLGPQASDQSIRQAMDTWRVLLWQWQHTWLRNSVERIEINEDRSTIAVTFSSDAGAAFLPENGCF